MITRTLASALLLSACVANGTVDDEDGGLDGKADDVSAPRTLTLSVDRRPVDGALVEISLVPVAGGRFATIVDRTAFNRAAGHDIHDRSTLFARGTCSLDLDTISCASDADLGDVTLEATRTGATWAATSNHGSEATPFDSGLTVRHVRFSRYSSAARTRVELEIDTGANGQAATLRTTYLDRTTNAQDVRVLLSGAKCTFDTGAVACVVDRRPVDGMLSELHVDLNASGAYVATLHTEGGRLDGTIIDKTETLAKSLALR